MTFKERILFSVASWKWWQRYAVTILFLCVLVTLWWFLSYRFIWSGAQQVHTHNRELRKQMVAVSEQEIITHSAELPAECAIEPIGATFDKRLSAFFMLKSMRDVTNKVLASCAQEQLQLDNYTVSLPQAKDWYTHCEMNIVLGGEFFKAVNFFERLQRYDNIMIQRCEMTLSSHYLVRCACNLSIILPLA